jgi:hypothetical protein
LFSDFGLVRVVENIGMLEPDSGCDFDPSLVGFIEIALEIFGSPGWTRRSSPAPPPAPLTKNGFPWTVREYPASDLMSRVTSGLRNTVVAVMRVRGMIMGIFRNVSRYDTRELLDLQEVFE